MQIIVDKADGRVIYAAEELFLDNVRASNGSWVDHGVTTENSDLIEVEKLPDQWVGSAYSYLEGEFVVSNQLILDATFPPPKTEEQLKAEEKAAHDALADAFATRMASL